jgi:hypothetical protein
LSERDEAESFSNQVAELFAARVKAFALWCETQWTITHEEAERDNLKMTPEQVEGWNRAVQSLSGAASVWLEEFD